MSQNQMMQNYYDRHGMRPPIKDLLEFVQHEHNFLIKEMEDQIEAAGRDTARVRESMGKTIEEMQNKLNSLAEELSNFMHTYLKSDKYIVEPFGSENREGFTEIMYSVKERIPPSIKNITQEGRFIWKKEDHGTFKTEEDAKDYIKKVFK